MADKKRGTVEIPSTTVSNYVKFEIADKQDARAVSPLGKRQKLDNILSNVHIIT